MWLGSTSYQDDEVLKKENDYHNVFSLSFPLSLFDFIQLQLLKQNYEEKLHKKKEKNSTKKTNVFVILINSCAHFHYHY